jgi:hypothetical protein
MTTTDKVCLTCGKQHPTPTVTGCRSCGRMLVHPDSLAHGLCVACRKHEEDR